MKYTDVAVVGAGSVGVACAYYLKQFSPGLKVTLIDSHAPLTLTSAHSGENYRNWWPHPTMKRFIDRSLDLLETIESHSGRSMRQNARGYLLCTASKHPDALLDNLNATFGRAVRFHRSMHSIEKDSVDGVDVLQGKTLIGNCYPQLGQHAQTLVHIRRGGALDSQLLANTMLEQYAQLNGDRISGKVVGVERDDNFKIDITSNNQTTVLRCQYMVNAAGPFAIALSQMLGVSLPLSNVLQQKVSFEDSAGVIPRALPFTIDLDPIALSWSDEERALLSADKAMQFYTGTMPGAIHCRPEGQGQWVKLGWAFNTEASRAVREPVLNDEFPEIVLRGASRLHPGLQRYVGAFPGRSVHYGGFYTMTDENWPLIGNTDVPGYLLATGLSGFGSMAACATGELVASLVTGDQVESYSDDLSLARYANRALMHEIAVLGDKGLL